MTILEQRFMETAPLYLKEIAEQLKKLVQLLEKSEENK